MRRFIVLAAATLTAGLAACGGGGDSFSGGSVEAFCAEIERLEAMPETDDPTEALEAFANLVDKAPNGEVRGALLTLSGLLESFGDFDENDPDAFGVLFALFMNPEVIEASETLEKFGVEECGLDPTDASGDPTDNWTDADDDPDFSGNAGASVFDDVSAGDLSDAVGAHLAATSPGYAVSSSSLSSAGDHTLVEVTLAGEGDLDAVAVCEAADAWLSSQSSDRNIALRISLESTGETLAGYEPGGTCAEG